VGVTRWYGVVGVIDGETFVDGEVEGEELGDALGEAELPQPPRAIAPTTPITAAVSTFEQRVRML